MDYLNEAIYELPCLGVIQVQVVQLISTVIAESEALKRSQKGLGLSEKNRDGKIGSESPVSVVSGFHGILINSTLVFFFFRRMIDDLWESCISQFHKNLRVSSVKTMSFISIIIIIIDITIVQVL